MKGFDQINACISNNQLTSSDWALDVQKEEQLNHELFSVYSANYNPDRIKGFFPPEDTIRKCKCKATRMLM